MGFSLKLEDHTESFRYLLLTIKLITDLCRYLTVEDQLLKLSLIYMFNIWSIY